jgi:predicted amidophosphoribosyltransferase
MLLFLRPRIKNAFQLRTIPKAHHIAILDDVLTTGATANELASVIKASGISRVDVWVLASECSACLCRAEQGCSAKDYCCD